MPLLHLGRLELPLNTRIYCVTVKCSSTYTNGQDLLSLDLPAIALATAAATLLTFFTSLAHAEASASRRAQLIRRVSSVMLGGSAYWAATAYRSQLIAEVRLAELGGGTASESVCAATVGECLTVAGKWDGFGEQLNAMIGGYAHCEFCGCQYVHTKMRTIYLSGTSETNMSSLLAPANRLVSKLFRSLSTFPARDGPCRACLPASQWFTHRTETHPRRHLLRKQQQQPRAGEGLVEPQEAGWMQEPRQPLAAEWPAHGVHLDPSLERNAAVRVAIRAAAPLHAPSSSRSESRCRSSHRASQAKVLNIAVHVRRGDVSTGMDHRYISDSRLAIVRCWRSNPQPAG